MGTDANISKLSQAYLIKSSNELLAEKISLDFGRTVFGGLIVIGAAIGILLEPCVTEARSRIEFVDVHVHLIGGRGNNEDYEGAENEAIEHMNPLGIRKAIILTPPQVVSQHWYDYASFVNALGQYPDRFSCLGGE